MQVVAGKWLNVFHNAKQEGLYTYLANSNSCPLRYTYIYIKYDKILIRYLYQKWRRTDKYNALYWN